jgi:hypothetical protein
MTSDLDSQRIKMPMDYLERIEHAKAVRKAAQETAARVRRSVKRTMLGWADESA